MKGKNTSDYVQLLSRLKEAGILKGEVYAPLAGKSGGDEEWSILNWENFAKVEFEDEITREFETDGIWLLFPDWIRELPDEEFREFFKVAEAKRLALSIYERLDRKKLFPVALGATTNHIKKAIREMAKEEDEAFAFAVKKMIDSKDGIGNGPHAIEHNMIKLAPVFTYVDSRELGGYSYESFPNPPHMGKPLIFIYDGNEGGFGLAEILYENVEICSGGGRLSLAQQLTKLDF